MNFKSKISQIIENDLQTDAKLQQICDVLKNNYPHFHWVGFYFINGTKQELKLAQFAGTPTEHTIIPFGKGICGQVAVSNKNFIVQDVSEQDNYISCGIDVKSEIVIPIFQKDKNIGQIDIDSHDKSPFTKEDEELLEYICEKVATLNLDGIINQPPF
ncbi:GAF domain-containing protein [Lutimonas sp.]|uniref:GAF domain-containing protein n=1 Tax=Lutimonas sp. TaxID=1872403 RepID=UPI003D9BC38D